jgi:hypothetical protein
MSFGTVFTLFVVPVVYLFLSGKHRTVEMEKFATDAGDDAATHTTELLPGT